MVIGSNHEAVIENIKDAAQRRAFYDKVEVGDPELTPEERADLIDGYLKRRYSLGSALANLVARFMTWVTTNAINVHTQIEGLENLKGIQGGAIITSNHFSPLDNTVVRKTINKAFHERIYIVSQDTNLAMKGIIGFLMNHADIIPLPYGHRDVADFFRPTIKERLEQGEKILIYPEQEMWLNYRKPRPPKRGAYYYAAINGVPVISFFVEIRTLDKKDTDEFYKLSYVMHVLPPIYPDPMKSIRETSKEMMAQDYKQKVGAYEKAYGRPLTYDFESGDIAGWIPGKRQEQ